jgi:pimeloyl-ACP methyl ester carboxylesterase
VHTARPIIDPSGQRASATDRLYLAEGMPTLIVWGARDPMIPAAHGIAAHALIPHSRLELFPDAGHYPFDEDPQRFAEVLRDFVAGSPAAVYDEEAVSRRLREGAPA